LGYPTPIPFDGDWPDNPTVRYLIYWSFRKKDLCDPSLCPDKHEDDYRCDACPLLKLENALNSERGQLVQKALDLRALLKAGVTITLDEIAADEMYALLIIEQEQNRYESDQSNRE
jgi:hypothetical protein